MLTVFSRLYMLHKLAKTSNKVPAVSKCLEAQNVKVQESRQDFLPPRKFFEDVGDLGTGCGENT